MELLLKKVEGCLGGTPAKAPVAAINALIDLKNVRCQSPHANNIDQLPQAVGDNNDALRDTINQTAERLKDMDKVIDDGVPDAALARMKTFAEYVLLL